jgi:hypothetical protein
VQVARPRSDSSVFGRNRENKPIRGGRVPAQPMRLIDRLSSRRSIELFN